MDFDQFKIQVVDEMRERFPDLDIGIQAVSKLQGESYTGLAVSPAGSNVAATMNLDYVYKRVEDGIGASQKIPHSRSLRRLDGWTGQRRYRSGKEAPYCRYDS